MAKFTTLEFYFSSTTYFIIFILVRAGVDKACPLRGFWMPKLQEWLFWIHQLKQRNVTIFFLYSHCLLNWIWSWCISLSLSVCNHEDPSKHLFVIYLWSKSTEAKFTTVAHLDNQLLYHFQSIQLKSIFVWWLLMILRYEHYTWNIKPHHDAIWLLMCNYFRWCHPCRRYKAVQYM